MTVVWIVLVCLLVAVIAGTVSAMARKRQAEEQKELPDPRAVNWLEGAKAEGVSGLVPIEPPDPEPPETVP